MKEHKELTLNCYKKWDLIRYIMKLENNINKAIKKLDNVSSPDVRKAIKILRQDDILKHTNEGETNNDKETAIDTSIGVIDTNETS